MTLGTMLDCGDVILAGIQFTDTLDIKKRPAVVLFEEYDNVVIAGITSNIKTAGIPLTKVEGALKESIIKVNYIFTISRVMVVKRLFALSKEKKKMLYDKIEERIRKLIG